jgi:hypothetical protein
MSMTDLLARAGRALHGPVWRTGLAGDLSVSRNTLDRWVSGREAVPVGVWGELRERLAKRAELAKELADAVAKYDMMTVTINRT